jgi:hypothetical protein
MKEMVKVEEEGVKFEISVLRFTKSPTFLIPHFLRPKRFGMMVVENDI